MLSFVSDLGVESSWEETEKHGCTKRDHLPRPPLRHESETFGMDLESPCPAESFEFLEGEKRQDASLILPLRHASEVFCDEKKVQPRNDFVPTAPLRHENEIDDTPAHA
jgi:hypothetical protein